MDIKEHISKLIQLSENVDNCSRSVGVVVNEINVKLDNAHDIFTSISNANSRYIIASSKISDMKQELRKIVEYTKVSNIVEPIIHVGLKSSYLLGHRSPEHLPAVKFAYTKPLVIECSLVLRNFLSAMALMIEAIHFFEERLDMKLSLPNIARLKPLLTKGYNECCRGCQTLLLANNKVNQIAGTNPIQWEIDKDWLQNLISLYQILMETNMTEHLVIYRRARVRRIQSVVDHYEKTNSIEDIWKSGDVDIPYSPGSLKLESYFQFILSIAKLEKSIWQQVVANNQPMVAGEEEFETMQIQVFLKIWSFIIVLLEKKVASLVPPSELGSISTECKLLLIRLEILDLVHRNHEEFCNLCAVEIPCELFLSLWDTFVASIIDSCVATIKSLLTTCLHNAFQHEIHASIETSSRKSIPFFPSMLIDEEYDPTLPCEVHLVTTTVIQTVGTLLSHCSCSDMSANDVNYDSIYAIVCSGIYNQDEYEVSLIPTVIPVPGTIYEFIVDWLQHLVHTIQVASHQFEEYLRWMHRENLTASPSRRALHLLDHSLHEMQSNSLRDYLLPLKKYLFLLNNFYSVYSFLQKFLSGFKDDSLSIAKPTYLKADMTNKKIHAFATALKQFMTIRDNIDQLITKAKDDFCDSASVLLGLSDLDIHDFERLFAFFQRKKNNSDKDSTSGKNNVISNQSLNFEQCRLLKAKFMIFNSGMDALLAKQGEWHVPFIQLRKELTLQMAAHLYSRYNIFYQNYAMLPFTKKHRANYLQYTPQQVETSLVRFFGNFARNNA